MRDHETCGCALDWAKRRHANVPTSFKDDEVVTSSALKTSAAKLTVAFDYADDALFSEAKAKPVSLPYLLFNEVMARKVLKTKGVVCYESEATCV